MAFETEVSDYSEDYWEVELKDRDMAIDTTEEDLRFLTVAGIVIKELGEREQIDTIKLEAALYRFIKQIEEKNFKEINNDNDLSIEVD